ncbi:MAG: ATP-binding protein [Candidatus Diapherotrites archaeon]|nr:ATP-binding protein [Candidatus Diapherotrites archaeon]
MGKSSIAASLAVLLARDHSVVAADCDVDAANLALVLGVKQLDEEKSLSVSEKARLVPGKCTGCGRCAEVCVFGAVKMVNGLPVFNDALCEGCGACVIACPSEAIVLKPVQNATIGTAVTPYGFPVVSAQLKMGEASSGKVVFEVKRLAESIGADVLVIDCAAGIGCPVVASVQGCDFVVAVTEPTPAALWDLSRALGVVEHFGIPAGIVINKADLNPRMTEEIRSFATKKNLNVLAEIPYDMAFVEALVLLKPVIVRKPGLEPVFRKILEGVMR